MRHPPLFKRGFPPPVARHPKVIRRVILWMRTTGVHDERLLAAARGALSTIVHASGCVPLLLYVLLYRADAYLPGQLDRTLADFALSTGVGLFVPKPTRDAACQHSYSV